MLFHQAGPQYFFANHDMYIKLNVFSIPWLLSNLCIIINLMPHQVVDVTNMPFSLNQK